MTEQINSFRGFRILVGAAAFVIIIAGLYIAQSVIVLLLISFFLALLGTPPVIWLKKKHIPSVVSVLIVMAGMVFIIILIGAQIGSSFSNFLDQLPLFQSSIREQVLELSAYLRSKGFSGTQKLLLDYVKPEVFLKLTANLSIWTEFCTFRSCPCSTYSNLYHA